MYQSKAATGWPSGCTVLPKTTSLGRNAETFQSQSRVVLMSWLIREKTCEEGCITAQQARYISSRRKKYLVLCSTSIVSVVSVQTNVLLCRSTSLTMGRRSTFRNSKPPILIKWTGQLMSWNMAQQRIAGDDAYFALLIVTRHILRAL